MSWPFTCFLRLSTLHRGHDLDRRIRWYSCFRPCGTGHHLAVEGDRDTAGELVPLVDHVLHRASGGQLPPVTVDSHPHQDTSSSVSRSGEAACAESDSLLPPSRSTTASAVTGVISTPLR